MGRATLLKNISTLITMEPLPTNEAGILRDIDLLAGPQGKIEAIGKNLSCPNADVFDMDKRVVMPGFVNAHDHLWQSLIRGLAPQDDLIEWLPKMYRVANEMRKSEAQAAVALSAAYMIDVGVTTVLDWCHGPSLDFLEGNVEALQDSGLRWGLAYAGPKSTSAEGYLKNACRHFMSFGRHHYASHPAPDLIADISESSRQALANETFLNVHFLEHKNQSDERPEEILKNSVPAGSRLILNHAVHLAQDHIDVLPYQIGIVHCPMSNLRLASGIFDYRLCRKNKIPVALGLDGGTNDAGDMFETMRLAVGLQRAKACSTDVPMTYLKALQMATVEGANTLGIGDDVGSLRVGKLSDLIVLNTSMLNAPFSPMSVESIILTMNSRNVERVMVGGIWKKFEGRLLNCKTEDVISDAQRAYRRLTERLH